MVVAVVAAMVVVVTSSSGAEDPGLFAGNVNMRVCTCVCVCVRAEPHVIQKPVDHLKYCRQTHVQKLHFQITFLCSVFYASSLRTQFSLISQFHYIFVRAVL